MAPHRTVPLKGRGEEGRAQGRTGEEGAKGAGAPLS